VVRRPACWHLHCSLPVRKVSCSLRGSQEQEVLSQSPGRKVHISALVRLASDFVSSLRLKITYNLQYYVAQCLDRTPYEYSYCWVNIRMKSPLSQLSLQSGRRLSNPDFGTSIMPAAETTEQTSEPIIHLFAPHNFDLELRLSSEW
jgi:hypothetical protein